MIRYFSPAEEKIFYKLEKNKYFLKKKIHKIVERNIARFEESQCDAITRKRERER